jgi:hypothetical protein
LEAVFLDEVALEGERLRVLVVAIESTLVGFEEERR